MQVPIPREKLSYSTRNECFPSTPSPVPHSQYCECAYLSGPFIFIFFKKTKLFACITIPRLAFWMCLCRAQQYDCLVVPHVFAPHCLPRCVL